MSKEIYEKLSKVQQDLKVPKNQFNDFGGYSFRSCEDILEAAKPVLAEYGLMLKLSDELVVKGDRYYIKATATVIDLENGDQITSDAYAREAENKKGMDKSQITGTASSYARKYALDGMFALDESKDSDSTNKHGEENSGSGKDEDKTITEDTLSSINDLIDKAHDIAEGKYSRKQVENRLYDDFADHKDWKNFFINKNSTSEDMAQQFLDYLEDRLGN